MVVFFKKAVLALLLVSVVGPQTPAQDRRIQRAGATEIRKHALVVGNDAYQRSPLANAVNDANSMHKTLLDMDFAVETVTDTDYPTFDRTVDMFIERLSPGDVALFYYAGHGVQVDGENYLMPVDFDRAKVAKVKYRALPADLIRERMEKSGAQMVILILDACRDNPFHGNRSVGPGLAQMATGIGTFIAFSTAPGQTAADNPSEGNGLFTQHLISTLEAPGLSIDEVFNEVRRKVFEASEGRQIPWTASSLIGSFFFRPAPEPRSKLRISRRQATGSLDVTVNRGGAAVYLDGDQVATSTGAETISLDEIPIGDYVVRVSKAAYLDVVRTVRVKPGTTASLEAWLSSRREANGTSSRREAKESAVAAVEPSQPPPVATYAAVADTTGDFCDTLGQVLSACPTQFRDIVVPSRSLTRTFLEPTVCLPGAWYNRVYRAAPESFEYLSSFEADLAVGQGRRLEAFVSRLEACLPDGAVAWHQRRSTRHQLKVALDGGDCQVDVAVSGENVDLEIYPGAR